ncbi:MULTISPECIES: hotdog fold thioesterase [Legionella]|uniref:Hotdog fold thioesterase n=1 Tax=Legionella septentrionalis TaxID=2498109 RepID=A0A433JJE9_9GAMM|nr:MULTISPECIES: hotdog fold thioesterase [Legionella]MCP0912883.1 hotdog fold thioesterase [Legionella sp. 27cVA30]RUQ88346.1 hotdog fold thioesterase [Legionella septentrionalis]RUQ95145.1 hotdog fold thioesterase [Legionella septentrionalis]RUR08879.1 hotdog fold thioesterase [Legionella septentrionalis]RUR12869.1 hotdog fold thioesterase [Legionella septentrionalis]
MAIWFKPFTLDDLTNRGKNTMADFLGIQFIEIGDDYLKATMPATPRTKQPIGIVHGGANVVLAETIASTAANAVVDLEHYYCVGLEINANHIRPVREGIIVGITRPIHLGRTTQVWQIDLFNEEGKQTCVSRMTASVVKR